jgi:hypothetical protein
MMNKGMLSRHRLYTGTDSLLPDQVPLRAGPLSLLFDQGDLRSIRLGEHEIIRRIYVAIRDRNWNTIAPVFTDLQMQVEPDQFTIHYEVENRMGEIDFAWRGKIVGEMDGSITFRMDGVAISTFFKNRIGFCVLHPASLAGKPAIIEHTDGVKEETNFTEDICADQPLLPFAQLSAIRHEVTHGVWAEVRMGGDIFEMEDQRLWTDASFKTYGTPLSLPYPIQIQAGTKVIQSIALRLYPEERAKIAQVSNADSTPASSAGSYQPIQLVLNDVWKPLPLLGLSMASEGETLTDREVGLIRALHLNHLRVELCLANSNYLPRFSQGIEQASRLGLPLEVALGLRAETADQDLSSFRQLLDQQRPTVCGWLVFPDHESYAGGNPSEEIAHSAWQILKPYNPSTALAVGTNTDFVFLKRTQLPLDWMDQVCITLNPQVHASDNQSMIETLEAQPVVIESARRLARGKPVVVSPITLKPRFNPYATEPQSGAAPGRLPARVDPRQMSLFGAGWTLGSISAMISGHTARVTYFETTGWCGVMENEQGSLLPQAFPSLPGSVFPLYHVLADLGEFLGGQAAILASGDAHKVIGLALRKYEKKVYILANLTAEVQSVLLQRIAGDFYARYLDETNAEAVMQAPETFRRSPGKKVTNGSTGLRLEIKPFGILRLEEAF